MVGTVSAEVLEQRKNTSIYVVESDPSTRAELNSALAGLPWPVVSYETPQAFFAAIPASARGCVVANIELVDMPISNFLQIIEDNRHQLVVILLSRNFEIPAAVAAMRAGVHDVIQLPVIERALRRQIRDAISIQAES